MINPTIEELQNNQEYKLVAELNHKQIKEFVMKRLSSGGKIVQAFMIYQILMILIGIFFFTRSVLLFFQNQSEAFFYVLGALVFCFSLLIIIHELLHGIALKLIGAKNINFGGYLKKFIFYAEADQFVLNKKQFTFIALAPLIAVKVITLAGILFFMESPWAYFSIIVMSAHSLFCAGDIGLLSIFYQDKDPAIFTYDVKEEKTSYYYSQSAPEQLVQ